MLSLASAIGLVLVFEGVLPFLAPGAWRTTMRRIGSLTDGQIRFIGLVSLAAGLGLMLL